MVGRDCEGSRGVGGSAADVADTANSPPGFAVAPQDPSTAHLLSLGDCRCFAQDDRSYLKCCANLPAMADVISSLSIQKKHFLSDKVSHFTESVIREMTRQAMLYGAVNLAQGFPDFPAPAEIKKAAQEAVADDVNQYAITWGARNLRQAIARQMGVWQGIAVDPEKEITVCCGSTEAMISTLLSVCNAGDEVVIFEPFYENYGPDSVLSGAKPKFVKLRPPASGEGEWTFDEKELRWALDRHTKAIILNTPNNPTGKA